jgi:hypothetical protein
MRREPSFHPAPSKWALSEVKVLADGSVAAHPPGRDFGTSPMKGSYLEVYPVDHLCKERAECKSVLNFNSPHTLMPRDFWRKEAATGPITCEAPD